MTKRILIDARQTEETRVVLLSGTRIDDFDYETENRKQLKGNVYLARVTRVEPSLQAAFIEYGGNRQGFLAFGEIHPDYYRIPVEDREALIEAERVNGDEEVEEATQENAPETVGGENVEDDEIRPKRYVKRYKIQEVISRKQIMLIQVVKEERGNKGAALTTYLSLAGRYCVLMPNNSRGGGVSRKITNLADRKRLKTVVGGLKIAKGMAVIVRTAGAKRTKTEIARDYTYLSKLWDEIRNRTLESKAPCMIHEEGDLIKRSIRDMYTSEIDKVFVEGEEAYKIARNQMKMLIPSHVKNVKKFQENQPIFQYFNVESQIDSIQSPKVTLKSGGYLVINQTEALVAVDVNSGKSTRERNIEETALKTNLEAADELARQLRLRDMSGLIVVDFIDMEDNRNQHAVERRMKEAMRNDRARIQVGSISHFGLLEMSRQRLRLSINESISNLCPHCEGTGRIRSIDTAAMQVLRTIEEGMQRSKLEVLHISMHRDIALFILNHKRTTLADIESRYSMMVIIHSDDNLIAPECRVERDGFMGQSQQRQHTKQDQHRLHKMKKLNESEDDTSENDSNSNAHSDEALIDEDLPKRRRRGRRGGRRRRGKRNGEENQHTEAALAGVSTKSGDSDSTNTVTLLSETKEDTKPQKPGRGRSRNRSDLKDDAVKTLVDNDNELNQKPATDSHDSESDNQEMASETTPAKLTKIPRKKVSQKDTKSASITDKENIVHSGNKNLKAGTKKNVANRKNKIASSGAKKKTVLKNNDNNIVAKKPTSKTSSKTSEKTNLSKSSKTKTLDTKKSKKAVTGETISTRAPISSAPQNITEVGNETPSARKRGWWSRR